ncbi:MAG: carbohydrate ABC transporter permease [Fimbriimonadia bacterium]|jgi:multiple sugar transport system permease protein
MTLHSALIPVTSLFLVFALWLTGWAGIGCRGIIGRWSWVFLVFGSMGVVLVTAALGVLVSSPPGEPARFGYSIHTQGKSYAILVAVGSLMLLGTLFGALFAGMRSRRGLHATRGAARDSLLHIVLTAGLVVFGIPFAWLVVTSFKEDVDMAKVPPVWVPRVQQYVQIEGRRAALVTGEYRGTKFKGAAVREFADGRRTIQILEPERLAGTRFTARTGDTENVREVGLKWENYARAVRSLPEETVYGTVYVFNTLLLVALNMAGTLLSSSIVGYAFARLRFPGRDAIFLMLLATLMLPGAVTMLPVFLIFRSLGWVDTLYPLWVPSLFGSAFNIFLLRQFFLTVPMELEEAARIDGCGYVQTYWSIMLPQVRPALAAVAIWTFTGTWNNFMGPLIYINSPERMPVSYALQLFQSAHGGDPGALMAATTMVMLPVVLVFFFAQRYFIEGVTLTGMGGR